MHVISDLGGPGGVPDHPPGTLLTASIDVEWTKNYRITNGNQAFCYSIVWLPIPVGDAGPAGLGERSPFACTSVYLDHDSERQALVEMAAADISAASEAADLVTGHQLCSDLAVLTACAGAHPPAALQAARQAWHERRSDPRSRLIDTRFDAGHLLAERSRRLVDVCTELDLDVTQPELTGKSMTALHRDWLSQGDTEARERVTVLNLRHSLSTSLVAARAAGRATWNVRLNVNKLILTRLGSRVGWLDHPMFTALAHGTQNARA